MTTQGILATTTRIDLLPDTPKTNTRLQNETRPQHAHEQEPIQQGGADFQQLFNSVYDGALLTDSAGRIHNANDRACQFLKYSHKELVGGNVINLLYDAEPPLLDEIHESLEKDIFILIQAACICSDDSTFPAEISVNNLTLENYSFLCFFIRDTSIRREAEEHMRTGNTAIQNAAIGIAAADLQGNINYVNAAILELWGLNKDEDMLGNNIEDFLCDQETKETIITAISRRLAWEQDLTCRTTRGTNFYVRASIAPNVNANDEITGMVLSLLDVTRLRLTAQTLEETLSNLRRSNQDLEQFAYAISHDLQAPLRKISTFTEIIKSDTESELTETMQDYLGRMENASERMRTLIEGLLRYSRITTTEVPHEVLDLNEIVTNVISDLEAHIFEAKGRINVSPLPPVAADPTQMRQLFQNLIGNAVKFHTHDVPPVVDIQAEEPSSEGEDQSTFCIINVTDNGIGFPAKDADRIFGVFQQLNSKAAYEGSGIGLAICRKIVERHGGNLTAESTEGQGASFKIMLPRA